MPRKRGKKSSRKELLIGAFSVLIVMIAFAVFLSGQGPQAAPAASQSALSAAPASPSASPSVSPSAAPASPQRAESVEGQLVLHALPVGQADALVLVSPSGKTMMVDAGETDAFPVIAAALKELGIERIDALVATHPHADHIGSMQKVIENYEVGHVYMSHATHTTSLYRKLLGAIEQKKLPLTIVHSGMHIDWDDNVQLDVFAPQDIEYKNLNNYSVALKFTFGQTAFLLTGDAEKASEAEMLEAHQDDLRADVLKAGHHGSITSSTEAFLRAVSPRVAILTVAPDDDDGLHPNPKVVKRLKDLGARVLSTAAGRVTVVSDGNDVSVTTESP